MEDMLFWGWFGIGKLPVVGMVGGQSVEAGEVEGDEEMRGA